mmetsp:Transcript_39673/g.71211  ORF Transcript_39673/g.71211 Transcript_39673/m.71211 type:complete len:416 (-) Transcript_39673:623-1870(-)
MLLQVARQHRQLLQVHHRHPLPSCRDPSPSLPQGQTNCQAGAVTHCHHLSFQQRHLHRVLHQRRMSQPGLAHQQPVHGLALHFPGGPSCTVMLPLALQHVQRQQGPMLHLGRQMCPAHPSEAREGSRPNVCQRPQQLDARHRRRRAARAKACVLDCAAQVMGCAVQLECLLAAECTETTWSLESAPVFFRQVQHWANCHAGTPMDVFLHCSLALCGPEKSLVKAFCPATKPQMKHVNLPVTWDEKLAEMGAEMEDSARRAEKECVPAQRTAFVIEVAICQLKVLWRRSGASCPLHASHPQASGPGPAAGQRTASPSVALWLPDPPHASRRGPSVWTPPSTTSVPPVGARTSPVGAASLQSPQRQRPLEHCPAGGAPTSAAQPLASPREAGHSALSSDAARHSPARPLGLLAWKPA